ncbi:hypothetical protein [Williamwhitmania taraxaci]|uniref:Uncharacterized protein n=1 Tax=Williamwhitmania taraxaci TaxID=1640674 RepID=A0A1G6QLV5_9BACT|nr:hypothetical protein [Williamwhitmania taraxaci]SDC93298.1 hypothetical protein SAMN05216323_10637 [Williamwhitmania taraxaci]
MQKLNYIYDSDCQINTHNPLMKPYYLVLLLCLLAGVKSQDIHATPSPFIIETSDSLKSLNKMNKLRGLDSLNSLNGLNKLQDLDSLNSLNDMNKFQDLNSLNSLDSLSRLKDLNRLDSLKRLN